MNNDSRPRMLAGVSGGLEAVRRTSALEASAGCPGSLFLATLGHLVSSHVGISRNDELVTLHRSDA